MINEGVQRANKRPARRGRRTCARRWIVIHGSDHFDRPGIEGPSPSDQANKFRAASPGASVAACTDPVYHNPIHVGDPCVVIP